MLLGSVHHLPTPANNNPLPLLLPPAVGGWTVDHEGLTFASVRGAGHMVSGARGLSRGGRPGEWKARRGSRLVHADPGLPVC